MPQGWDTELPGLRVPHSWGYKHQGHGEGGRQQTDPPPGQRDKTQRRIIKKKKKVNQNQLPRQRLNLGS